MLEPLHTANIIERLIRCLNSAVQVSINTAHIPCLENRGFDFTGCNLISQLLQLLAQIPVSCRNIQNGTAFLFREISDQTLMDCQSGFGHDFRHIGFPLSITGAKKERPLCYTHLGGTPMPEKVMQTENAHIERPCQATDFFTLEIWRFPR